MRVIYLLLLSFVFMHFGEQAEEEDLSLILEVDEEAKEHAAYIEKNLPNVEVVATYDLLFHGIAVKGSQEAIKKVEQLDFIIASYPVQTYTALAVNPSDLTTESTPASDLNAVLPAEINDTEFTGKGIKVGVIDTGIDYEHPDLRNIYQGGKNFVEHDEDYARKRDDDDPYETSPEDRPDHMPEFDEIGNSFYTSHGTHVAGIIAGAGNNDYEIKGVAPDIDLYAYRVLGAYGSGLTSWCIAGIGQAVIDEMDVINLRLGGGGNSVGDPTSVG